MDWNTDPTLDSELNVIQMCAADLKGGKEDAAGSGRSSRIELPLLGIFNRVEK